MRPYSVIIVFVYLFVFGLISVSVIYKKVLICISNGYQHSLNAQHFKIGRMS